MDKEWKNADMMDKLGTDKIFHFNFLFYLFPYVLELRKHLKPPVVLQTIKEP